jgi:hypothetical protein
MPHAIRVLLFGAVLVFAPADASAQGWVVWTELPGISRPKPSSIRFKSQKECFAYLEEVAAERSTFSVESKKPGELVTRSPGSKGQSFTARWECRRAE